MTIEWPCEALPSRNIAIDLAPRTLAGPSSISGKTQVVSSGAGIWKVRFSEVVIRNRASVLTFRALAALLEGRLGSILVPVCHAYQPTPDGTEFGETVEHSDGSPFDDGSSYQQGSNDVEAVAYVPVGAVSMTISVAYGGDILPGQHFSIGERLYRVRTFDATSGAMTFRPPLREQVPAGTKLNFDEPVCRMRLATDQEMDLELSMRKYGQPTINFIEDL